jgi:hypothetical protein
MMNPLRLLVAAALLMAIGSGKASAQTVMVRHVPGGDAVEVFLNATKVVNAVAEGERDLISDLPSTAHRDPSNTDYPPTLARRQFRRGAGTERHSYCPRRAIGPR